jgi:hypothetical protein
MLMYHGTPPYMAPRGQYAAYYAKSQFGHGILPAYGGVARQKGHGLGSLIGGLLRSAVPLISTIGRKVAKTAGSALLSTGAGVLSDVIAGKNFKTSVKSRAKQAGQQALKRASTSAQGYINGLAAPPPAKRRSTGKRARRTKQQRGSGKKKGSRKSSNHLF